MRPHLFIYLVLINFLALSLVLVPVSAYAQGGPSAFFDPSERVSAGSGDGFIAVTPSVDGGSVPIGSTAQVVVRFKNEGGKAIQTGLIRLYPSSTVSASVSLNQCEEEIVTPGAECAIALSVKGLQAGSWRVEMLMSHSGITRLVTATLNGQVEANAEGAEQLTSDVEAIPNTIDFGTLGTSQTLVEPIILRNITSNPIKLDKIYIDSSAQAGFTLKSDCKSLNPGQACIATIAWAPKIKGPVSGVMVIEHDGPAALASVPMKGTYSPQAIAEAEIFPEAIPGKGLLVASQSDVDFGTGVETASTITVSLVNVGDSDLTLTDIRTAGSDSGLGFKEGSCKKGDVLKPVEACPLTISWTPTRAGSLLDDVQVLHDGARGILVLPVRGNSSAAVSKDQGTILLANNDAFVNASFEPAVINPSQQDSSADDQIEQNQQAAAAENQARVQQPVTFKPVVSNPASVLDGLKITSFSPSRAIIAGPGGSRIVFHKEPIVIGGIPWNINIQQNGIEFSFQDQTVLLLFDRSLSSVNRIQGQSSSSQSSESGG